MDLRKALEELTGQKGPSGYEMAPAAAAAALLRPLMDEVWTDRLGSVIGLRRCGKENAPKLLLDAHLDEIGLVVTGIKEGFLQFRPIGGVDPRMLPDREVTVMTDPPLFGVVACLPPHVLTAADHDKSIPMEDLYIDVGLTQEEAERLIPIGTPMTYRCGCFPLGEGRICGKAMDDRSCFVALLRAAELLQDRKLDVDLYILGSNREEVGGYGALASAFHIMPDYCVAVDVTHGATPDVAHPKDRTSELGKGPVIGVGPRMAHWMSLKLEELAQKEHIPHQMEVMTRSTGTNGDEFQISREGVATAVVSLPLRYMHTPVEVLDLQDLEDLARLLAAFAADLGKGGVVPC